MSFHDLELKRAIVVVQALWDKQGSAPLSVEIAAGSSAVLWAWEQEAARWLQWIGLSNRYQRKLNLHEFLRGQPVPTWWSDLAGEHPGEDDPILSKEFRYKKVFYQNGPVKSEEKVSRGPVLS